ncbi:MAG TPA: deoxyribodipyrimidine photo-lyase [Vicinamibacterales bacterium]|nr:deoxyribodipyrimidine photo-lyase [Vicinamibacterales bacterium]
MPSAHRTLVWFRGKDLRVADHAPLRDAAAAGEVIPLFVLDPYFFAPTRARATPHRIQFLLESLRELESSLARLGSQLLVVRGRSVDVVPRLAHRWRADRVAAYGWVAPVGRERDRRVSEQLRVPFDLSDGETLLPPGSLRSGTGRPYAVYSAFRRAFDRAALIGAPQPAPRRLPPLPAGLEARTVPVPTCESLGVPINPRLQSGGEAAARRRLRRFLDGPAGDYHRARDRLDLAGTSRLSADLKFGTLSARTVWTAADRALRSTAARQAFLNELVWREFCHSTIFDRPELLHEPFRRDFTGFPWRDRKSWWEAWVAGATGYPVVDASARQLLAEGFVHNRARMISASFLAKHLLIDYRRGEAHYMRYLTDGDWANNNGGWQWAAGCGADAQPYFRIFNPVSQGRTFDPTGDYVRRWVPELARLSNEHIHAPWTAPSDRLEGAGVRLGREYPRPIVEHRAARERFLALAKAHFSRTTKRGTELNDRGTES